MGGVGTPDGDEGRRFERADRIPDFCRHVVLANCRASETSPGALQKIEIFVTCK